MIEQESSASPTQPIKTTRRRAQRRRIVKRGVVLTENESVSHECVVRNISETGALLKFNFPTPLPSEFDLDIEVDKVRYKCTLVWRKDSNVGVRFQSNSQGRLTRDQVIKPIYDRSSANADETIMAKQPEPTKANTGNRLIFGKRKG